MTAINFLPEITLEAKYEVKKLDNDEILKPNEYFVLRKQDILAVHTLWNYISNLRLAYELVKDENDADNMLELADQIASMATHWAMDNGDTKLPD